MSISKFGTNSSKSSNNKNIKVTGIENKVSKSGDSMYGDLNLNNHSIKNLASPEEESDAVNKEFLNNSISGFVSYRSSLNFGSKLAVIGLNENRKSAVSISPIQVRGSVIYGLQTIGRLPNTTFRIQSVPNNGAKLELDDSLNLKGVSYPVDLTDAANKQYVDVKFQQRFSNLESDIDLQRTHTIVNLRDPAATNDAVTKSYVDQITQVLQFIQTERGILVINQNMDFQNNSVVNLGIPLNGTSPITLQYFEQNSYHPTLHIFSGDLENTALQTNRIHTLPLSVVDVVGDNFLCTLAENSICLSGVVENNYLQINVSGLINVPNNARGDKVRISLVQVREGTEERKLGQTLLKPEFTCFNFTTLVKPNILDKYNIHIFYISSETSMEVHLNATIMVKLIKIV